MSASEAHTADAIERIVDTRRYPVSDPDHPVWIGAVARARHELRTRGCCVLREVIRPSVRDALSREGAAIAPRAYYDVDEVTVYDTAVDHSLPEGHPGRVALERRNAFVARDRIPADFLIHRLYTSPAFQHLVASCFDLPRVHELADPFAGLCLNVVPPGNDHPWHFDTNEFAVSLLTRDPEAGGEFEYCPDVRSPDAENFDAVRAVLDGRHPGVRRLTLRSGDLQLFRGRHSLHRVTAVRGGRPRHSAIFAYSARPGVVGTATRTRQLFGRVSAEHRHGDGHRVRGD